MTPAALFAGGLAAGLVAGTASCTAVQGGVLIALTGSRAGHRAPPSPPGRDRPPDGHPPRPCEVSGACGAGRAATGEPSSGPAMVTAFILGRLASHVLAGALLGLLGGVVRIPPEARAVLLTGAGTAVIFFAVRLVRNGGRAPDRSARHSRAVSRTLSPALVGAATIMIPCGVTLSTEVVAVSSGSWIGGAAVMAGFVAGTAPAFALLGLLVRRLATTRLASLAAAAALVAGSVTVVAGLRLGGWLPEFSPPVAAAPVQTRADGTQVVTIWSTDRGYRPAVAAIEADRPAEIVFRTLDNRGCTRTLTIQGRDLTLPVTGEATVRLAPQAPGRLRFVCGMGMYAGFIDITRHRLPAVVTLTNGHHQYR
ncbi:hypothetical protein GCM10022226_58110 [Sphaerisporangium flaviroseum]|uniref:Sulfite exporter TauE/SafE family protein n=1 Tax=Sphaerisporangium flaviroseum TaxID=509199 RepID=A0ABP7IXL0_9ACTN